MTGKERDRERGREGRGTERRQRTMGSGRRTVGREQNTELEERGE